MPILLRLVAAFVFYGIMGNYVQFLAYSKTCSLKPLTRNDQESFIFGL